MIDQGRKQQNIILSVTTVLVMAVTATQIVFSIRANHDINNNHDPCLPNLTPAVEPSSVSATEIISALVFALNTLPATINRLHVGVKDLVIGGRGSVREDYCFFRYVKRESNRPFKIVVSDQGAWNELALKLEEMGIYSSYYDIRRIISVPNDWLSVIPYDLTNEHKKQLKDRLIVLTDRWDKGFGGAMLIPLIVTTALSMLYSFYAYGEIDKGFQYASYALVPFLSLMKFYFRFDSTMKAGIKIKDAIIEHPLKAVFTYVLPVVMIAYLSMPYGLYYSKTVTNGAVDWMAEKVSHGACAVSQAQAFNLFVLWMTNLSFALGAFEGFKTFLSKPIEIVKDWYKELGFLLLLPLLVVGGADAYYSGYYYANILLSDYQSNSDALFQAPDWYVSVMMSLYVLMYVLYYSAGNVSEAAAIAHAVKEGREELPVISDNCFNFFNRDKAGASQPLLSGDNVESPGVLAQFMKQFC